MPSPYGVGCAYVCMGTWSSLQGVSVPTFLFGLIPVQVKRLSSTIIAFNQLTYNIMNRMLRLALVCIIAFISASCENDVLKSNDFTFSGKNYVYWQGEFDSNGVCQDGECAVYEFDKEGGLRVYGKVIKEVGDINENGQTVRTLKEFTFDTKGKSLYYYFDGSRITVYKGDKGWSKDERRKVFASGIYYSECLLIDCEYLSNIKEVDASEQYIFIWSQMLDYDWVNFIK